MANEPEPPTDPAPASVSKELIPIPQIPEQTEFLLQSLRRLTEAAAPDLAVARIEADLPQIRAHNKERLEAVNEILSRSPTLDRLGDAERELSRGIGLLRTRRELVTKRASALEEELVELSQLQEKWSRTLASARSSEVPGPVLATVRSNLEAIDKTSQIVRLRRGVVLMLLTSLSEDESEATVLRERLSVARSVLRAQILEPDSPPLWIALTSMSSSTHRSLFDQTLARGRADLSDFGERNARALIPIALVFAGASMLALYMRKHLRSRTADTKLSGSIGVFERPVSVAILTTAVVAAASFPAAPNFVRECVGLVLIVPVVRLLLPTVPAGATRHFDALVGFYVVDRIRSLIFAAEVLERIVFLAEMLVATAVLWHVLRPARFTALFADLPGMRRDIDPNEESSARKPAALGWIDAGLKLVFVAFGISAIAAVLGYVALAKLLGDGALNSIYFAILAFALYRVAIALVVVALSSRWLDWTGAIRSNREVLYRYANRILGVLALVFWVLRSLDSFEVREPVVDTLRAVLSTPLEWGTLSISLGDVIAFPLTMFLAFELSRAVRAVLEEDVFVRVHLARGVGNAVSTTAHYVLLLSGFFLALGAAGIDLSRFTLLAGAFGVGIGFGLQNVVNNFVSGLILLFERPIQVGDQIELGGLLGEVKHIGIRASSVVTFQGAEVIVPNGDLLSSQLVNWTLSNRHRRVELPVGVGYGHPPSKVIGVLEAVLEGDDRILSHPAPQVLFRGFGDSALDFELRFWARDYMTYLMLASDVATAVYDALKTAGIEIPFPQRDLHLRSVDAEAAKSLRVGSEPETVEEGKNREER